MVTVRKLVNKQKQVRESGSSDLLMSDLGWGFVVAVVLVVPFPTRKHI